MTQMSEEDRMRAAMEQEDLKVEYMQRKLDAAETRVRELENQIAGRVIERDSQEARANRAEARVRELEIERDRLELEMGCHMDAREHEEARVRELKEETRELRVRNDSLHEIVARRREERDAALAALRELVEAVEAQGYTASMTTGMTGPALARARSLLDSTESK